MRYSREEIEKMTLERNVVLFLNGTALTPKCWFSVCIIEVLMKCNVGFLGIDVSENLDLREAIKAYSCWPTFPQLFVRGEFIGGSHVVVEMYQSENLQQLLEEV